MSKLKAKSPDLVEPGKTKGLIFGASGVGKTWFTLSFPAPYYMDTEGGADLRHYQERLKSAGGVYMGPDEGTLDFQTVIEQMQALATEKHQYKTLIIDSITKLYQTALANEQERLGEKDAFGAYKKPGIAGMRRLVNWAMKLDMNIWFVAHEVPEWGLNPKNGQREEIGKLPDVWEKLVYELHLGLRIIRRGKTYPATAFVHKTRLIGFPDGDTFPLEYGEFATRYGKDYIESVAKPITLANKEQVDEISRLVGVLNIPTAEIEKLMTKANADNWNELSTEQAKKTLKWLNAKIKGDK
jgi:hypothetical protein